ncbi:hypothetical protein CNR22_03380 [Sphingobacteriaceae bacterium]|nr:hypothetical protein CNR22_03380 [Sphingobacteriaceae bacterium]
MKTLFYSILFSFFFLQAFSQHDSSIALTFDFNEHQIKEKNNKVHPTYSGATLIADRFGNEKSAVFLRGDPACYLSLGTSSLLKSPNITISFWVNLYRRNYLGRGNTHNPMITIKNGPGEDFINAITFFYIPDMDHVGAVSTKDSTDEVAVVDEEPFQFNKWYHYVIICNTDYLALYTNGTLRQKTEKNFETKFLASDSLVIGHSASKKNERMSIGTFDDIQIFHRSLSDQEIKALYEAPNPNAFKNTLYKVLKIGAILIGLASIILLLLFRNKRALRKQKEQLELRNRISQLEIKVIKTQMNPHFLSNSLAAIQNLMLQNEVDKASQYLAKFSHFLRQILEYSEKNYVTLDEELSIIKMNVELEQLRFKNDFSFTISIGENINPEDFLIPSLITHPFIENAIWHGLLPLEGKPARLTVSIYLEGGFGYVVIEDNGIGRSLSGITNLRKSMGSKLALDKIESINLLRNSGDFKLEIVDLFNADNTPCGTKVLIRLTHNTY